MKQTEILVVCLVSFARIHDYLKVPKVKSFSKHRALRNPGGIHWAHMDYNGISEFIKLQSSTRHGETAMHTPSRG